MVRLGAEANQDGQSQPVSDRTAEHITAWMAANDTSRLKFNAAAGTSTDQIEPQQWSFGERGQEFCGRGLKTEDIPLRKMVKISIPKIGSVGTSRGRTWPWSKLKTDTTRIHLALKEMDNSENSQMKNKQQIL